MDCIDATACGNVTSDGIGEFVDYIDKCLFGQVVRPSLDINDPMSRFDFHLRGQVGPVGPRVHDALGALLSKG
jgi:hypothetical protein